MANPDTLRVLLDGRFCGIVEHAAPEYRFTYDDVFRSASNSYPLSLSLPLAARAHRGDVVEFYLRALLPDNERRLNALAHRYAVDPRDPVALLAHVGRDCAGAVQFVTAEAAESEDDSAGIDWLDDATLAQLLRQLRSENEGGDAAIQLGQFSLPGALSKVALVYDEASQRFGRARGRQATTHILKPPLGGIPFHNENEHLCLELARACGLDAPRSWVLRLEDQSAIVVERYDRLRTEHGIARIHQEDASQALGVNPRLKYAAEGAPRAAAIAGLLRDYSADPYEDVVRFIRALAFNWIIAGTDAHPRNYSLIIGPHGVVRLAPLYDLASALVLPNAPAVEEMRLAMAIGGSTRLGDIDRAAWEREAKALRVRASVVFEEVRGVGERIISALEVVVDRADVELGFGGRFVDCIRARARSVGF